jgi:hypothetical protein
MEFPFFSPKVYKEIILSGEGKCGNNTFNID